MTNKTKLSLVIWALILGVLVNELFLGISFWSLNINYHLFCSVELTLFVTLLLYSLHSFKKNKPLNLFYLFISAFFIVALSVQLIFTPQAYKVDSLELTDTLKVDVYKLEEQNSYTFIQRDKFGFLSRNNCIYQYEHFTNNISWERFSESTFLVNGISVSTSDDLFPSIACPQN